MENCRLCLFTDVLPLAIYVINLKLIVFPYLSWIYFKLDIFLMFFMK